MNKLGRHAKRQRNVSNAMQSEKLEHRTSTNRGTAHQHNTTRREEEIPEDSVIRLGNVGSTAPKRRIIHKGQVAWMKPANERRWEHDTPKAVGARHATNEEALEKEAMEKEPHLTQMRLALTDISSDPAELCALPQMISLTAQCIAEAAKGSQNQCTEELQIKMRSLSVKKMWWKLDKLMMMMMILVIVTYLSLIHI